MSVGVKRHVRLKPSCLVSSQMLFYGDREILPEISVVWRSEHTHMTPRRVRVNHRPRWSDDLETPAPETFCLGHQTSPFRRACVCVVVSAFVSEVEQNMLFLMFFSCCVIESESILKKKLCTFGFIEVFDNSCRHGCRRLVYLTGPWSTCFSVIHLFIFLDSKRTYFKKSKIGDQISSDGMVFRKVPIWNRPWTVMIHSEKTSFSGVLGRFGRWSGARTRWNVKKLAPVRDRRLVQFFREKKYIRHWQTPPTTFLTTLWRSVTAPQKIYQ
jgi:hypothetical protein